MRAGLLLGALRRRTLHSPSICIQAKLRQSHKEDISQRTILAARQKVNLTADSGFYHFLIAPSGKVIVLQS
jgi:hypothetical protein